MVDDPLRSLISSQSQHEGSFEEKHTRLRPLTVDEKPLWAEQRRVNGHSRQAWHTWNYVVQKDFSSCFVTKTQQSPLFVLLVFYAI